MSKIEKLAIWLRSVLGIPDDVRLDPVDVLRRLRISKFIADFSVVPDKGMHGRAARWIADRRIILLSASLWERLTKNDDSDATFTIFHEVGHAALGHGTRNRMAMGKLQFGAYTTPDEQDADEFALAFAIPLSLIRQFDITDAECLARQSGLPSSMTDRRMIALQKHARILASNETDVTYFDSGDPDAAYAQMFANARRWN